MNRLTETQQRWNQQSAGHGPLAATHRRRVMEAIAANPPSPGSRICVLGAGNCNDLELPWLVQQFSEVVLVDLDAEALARGVERQGVADVASLCRHGGCDVTGVWHLLDDLSSTSRDARALDSLIEAAASPPQMDVCGPFDVVASTCLLSQLIQGVVTAVGETHPRFLDLLSAVRQTHLRLLSNLAAPLGRVVLIADFVSSDSAPEILTANESEVESLARQLIEQRNFFHGLNPAVLATLWHRDPALASAVEAIRVSPPWRWNLGPRSYLVAAFQATKKAAP